MKHLTLLPLLLIIGHGAHAEWVEVGATRIFTAYAEPLTIQKAGDTVKMWEAMDFTTTQSVSGMQFRSIKSQREFNCKLSSIRLLYTRYYTQKMGDGNVVATSNVVRDWAPVSPESIDEKLWTFACAKNVLPVAQAEFISPSAKKISDRETWYEGKPQKPRCVIRPVMNNEEIARCK